MYVNIKNGQNREFVSFFTTARVDIHWQANAKNTSKLKALAIVQTGFPVSGSLSFLRADLRFSSSESSPCTPYTMDNVDTITSLAANEVMIPNPIFHPKPIGSKTGSIILPILPA